MTHPRSTSADIAQICKAEGSDYDNGTITQEDVPEERRKFSWLEIVCILCIAVPVIVMLASLAVPIIGGLFE